MPKGFSNAQLAEQPLERAKIRAVIDGFDVEQYARYIDQRLWIETIWIAASKPLKFPARRRRDDRRWPKAA